MQLRSLSALKACLTGHLESQNGSIILGFSTTAIAYTNVDMKFEAIVNLYCQV
jgi:hypothetical protein